MAHRIRIPGMRDLFLVDESVDEVLSKARSCALEHGRTAKVDKQYFDREDEPIWVNVASVSSPRGVPSKESLRQSGPSFHDSDEKPISSMDWRV